MKRKVIGGGFTFGSVLLIVWVTSACLFSGGLQPEAGEPRETEWVERGVAFPHGAASIEIGSMEAWRNASHDGQAYECLSGNRNPAFRIRVECSADTDADCAFLMWVAVSHEDGMWGSMRESEKYPWNPIHVVLKPGESRQYGYSAGECYNLKENPPKTLTLKIEDPTGKEAERNILCDVEEAVPTKGPVGTEPPTSP